MEGLNKRVLLDNKEDTKPQSNAYQRGINTALKVVAFITVASIGFGAVGAFVPQQSLPSFLTGIIGTIGYEGAIACMVDGVFVILLYGIVKTVKKINQIRQNKLEQKSAEKNHDKVNEIDEYAKKNHLQPYIIHHYKQSNNFYTVFSSKNMVDGATQHIYVENCNSIDGGKSALVNHLKHLTDQSISAFSCTQKLEDLKIYSFKQENESRYTFFFRDPADNKYYFMNDCVGSEPPQAFENHLEEVKKQRVGVNAQEIALKKEQDVKAETQATKIVQELNLQPYDLIFYQDRNAEITGYRALFVEDPDLYKMTEINQTPEIALNILKKYISQNNLTYIDKGEYIPKTENEPQSETPSQKTENVTKQEETPPVGDASNKAAPKGAAVKDQTLADDKRNIARGEEDLTLNHQQLAKEPVPPHPTASFEGMGSIKLSKQNSEPSSPVAQENELPSSVEIPVAENTVIETKEIRTKKFALARMIRKELKISAWRVVYFKDPGLGKYTAFYRVKYSDRTMSTIMSPYYDNPTDCLNYLYQKHGSRFYQWIPKGEYSFEEKKILPNTIIDPSEASEDSQ